MAPDHRILEVMRRRGFALSDSERIADALADVALFLEGLDRRLDHAEAQLAAIHEAERVLAETAVSERRIGLHLTREELEALIFEHDEESGGR